MAIKDKIAVSTFIVLGDEWFRIICPTEVGVLVTDEDSGEEYHYNYSDLSTATFYVLKEVN